MKTGSPSIVSFKVARISHVTEPLKMNEQIRKFGISPIVGSNRTFFISAHSVVILSKCIKICTGLKQFFFSIDQIIFHFLVLLATYQPVIGRILP